MTRPENYAAMDEGALAAACAKRPPDCEAWNELSVRFRSRVEGWFRKRLGSDADTEDLTQEVFLRVFRTLKPDRGSLEALIFRTANSVLVDHWRRLATRGKSLSLQDELYRDAAQRGVPAATIGPLIRLALDSFGDPRIRQIAEEIVRDVAVEEICRKLNVKEYLVYMVRNDTEEKLMQQFEAYLTEKTKISR
jgi:DNA-directed RNA polymerase specialized sigma24 family protein